MRYRALAFDYDGTLAEDGRVDDSTVAALDRARRSGRRLLLVTGREFEDLERVFPRLEVFDRVVAENGGVLYRPDTRERVPLADPPPPELVDRLREQDVTPLGADWPQPSPRSSATRRCRPTRRELGSGS